MDINIRQVKLTDRDAWQQLWYQYLTFYKVENFNVELTQTLWQRIHIVKHPINCFVAENNKNEELVGFVHFFPHVDTWKLAPVCYLEDLFVSKTIRSFGVGEQLIASVVKEAKDKNWHHVYWKTQKDNIMARGLYDKLTGGTDGFITYRLPIVNTQ